MLDNCETINSEYSGKAVSNCLKDIYLSTIYINRNASNVKDNVDETVTSPFRRDLSCTRTTNGYVKSSVTSVTQSKPDTR